jgi:hypothetical protein
VLDNEANKFMLEADSLQALKKKYKLSYYEIEKKFQSSLASYSSSNDDKYVYSQSN